MLSHWTETRTFIRRWKPALPVTFLKIPLMKSSCRRYAPWLPADVGFPKKSPNGLRPGRLFEDLTPRELLILNEVVKGLANKQIADVLNISENTVKWHLKNILGKLCVADRAEAVAVAIQRGIIHLN